MAGRDLGAFTRYTDLGNPKERPSLSCTFREACNIFGLETVRKANCGPKKCKLVNATYSVMNLVNYPVACLSVTPSGSNFAGEMFLARRFYALGVFLRPGMTFGFGHVTYCHVIVSWEIDPPGETQKSNGRFLLNWIMIVSSSSLLLTFKSARNAVRSHNQQQTIPEIPTKLYGLQY